MNILEIEILFHYRCTPRDYRDGDFSAPAVERVIEEFLADDMLKPATGPHSTRKYELTDRAEFYIDTLQSIPLPKPMWVIPGFNISQVPVEGV